MDFDSKTRRIGLLGKQNDSRIGITLPTGESQLLQKINIYITVVSKGNSWATDKQQKQQCRSLYMCLCVYSIQKSLPCLRTTQRNETVTDVTFRNTQTMSERGKMCVCICECTLPYSTPWWGKKANTDKEIFCPWLLPELCFSTNKSSRSKVLLNFQK